MSERFRLARHCNEEGYKLLYDSIAKSMSEPPNPIMIGKIGANELLVIYQAIGILQNQIADFSPDIMREGCFTAGIYPPTKEGFLIFVNKYLEAIKSMNILASWNDRILQIEEYVWNNYIVKGKTGGPGRRAGEQLGIVELTSLESFYTEPKYWWQTLYENKTILIISPFVKSIEAQLQLSKRNKVWKGRWKGFWPESIKFKYIKCKHPYYLSSEEEKAKYPESLELIMKEYEKEIEKLKEGDGEGEGKDAKGNYGFDIALVGSGAYSILLCDYIKRMCVKSTFHLGGGLQMMFGVYGNRWSPEFNKSSFLKEYINADWIRPLEEERPPGYKNQEGGAYF